MGSLMRDDAVTNAIARLAGVDIQRVAPTTVLSDLVSDSFALVQLAIDIQDDFDVVFHAEDLNNVHDVGDLIDLIRSRS